MPATPFVPPVVGAVELAALLEASPHIRLLDVRTAAEFENVHIAAAVAA